MLNAALFIAVFLVVVLSIRFMVKNEFRKAD